MRTVVTFVLRLLVDTDDQGKVRGALRPLEQDGEHTFRDEAALLALLRRLVRRAEEELAGHGQASETPE